MRSEVIMKKKKIKVKYKYYCTCHQEYLTDEFVSKKGCLNRPTFDMIGFCKCTNIKEIN